MTETAIIAASGLLLFAYAIEHVGRRFKLPAVVLLIVTGLIARQVLNAFGLEFHWVEPIVPVIGTVGLILIVLEGSLDLVVTRERSGLIGAAATSSLLGFCATLVGFAMMFHFLLGFADFSAVLAAIPFAVISSAVAIPSAAALPKEPREFIVYESSLSDILGVLVFYAWAAANGDAGDFALQLFGGGALSLVAAAAAAIALYYFINQISGHVRFLPLLAGLVFLYAIGKALHLSPLIVVLVCGLVINNPHLIHWHAKLRALQAPDYDRTIKEFKGIVAELTFATKSFFFLLLGYWTDVRTMLSIEALLVAIAGIALILATRWIILSALRQQAVAKLIWIAPRGLITVLLFLSASHSGQIEGFPFGAVMLIVLGTAALTALAHRSGNRETVAASEVPGPVTSKLGAAAAPSVAAAADPGDRH